MSTFFFEFLIILGLIIANGIFSMAEMAVISARKVRLLQRAEGGDESARVALDLAEHPTHFFSTVQIGITLVGTLTGALGGAALAGELQRALFLIPVPFIQNNRTPIALALVVILITYLTLVLGELVPKRAALADPEGTAAALARPMRFLSLLARPLVYLLSLSTDAVSRLLRIRKLDDSPVTPEEITVLMEQGEQSGIFDEVETDLVSSVFRLGDLRAGSLMTPRTDLDWVDLDDSLDRNLKYIMESPHGHFPVAEGGLDNVQGILRGKDLLARTTAGFAVDLRELVLQALIVPESIHAFELIDLLRRAHGNLALVIDEYGGVLGMVTMFDVMEAIVGGISTRGEPVIPDAVQREDGSWLVEGMMRVDEFKKLFDLDMLPGEDRAGYQTVGGFIMSAIGSIPQAGQHFECCRLRFEVMDMDGLRVDKILISQNSADKA